MSTNKTENYSLHAWEPGDDFLRAEMNENFAKLDGSARWLAGAYTGTGSEGKVPSTLELEPWVKLVIIMGGSFLATFFRDSDKGYAYNPNGYAAVETVTWTDHAMTWTVTRHYMADGSAYITPQAGSQLNQKNTVYRYLALG